jgi:hypothetical protein
MGMMKDYLMFLEEKGIAEWSDYFDDWQFNTDNIYSAELMKEYNESRLSVSQDN